MKNWIAKCALKLLPLALVALATPTQAATLYGDTLSCVESGIFTCSTSLAVAGTGTEFAINGTFGGSFFTEDFTQTGLTLTATSHVTLGSGFSPIVNFDTTTPFTSAAFVSTTATTFSPANVSFSGGGLSIALTNIEFMAGQTLTIALNSAQVSSVPLPGSIVLLVSALAMLAFWKRSKFNA